MLEGKELTSIGNVLLELKPLSSAFPNLSRLVRIAMTIAVSTARCECSFSTLKLVNGHLQSTMGDERLANMAILSIEHEISAGMNLIEDVVTEFSGLSFKIRIKLYFCTIARRFTSNTIVYTYIIIIQFIINYPAHHEY